MIWAGDLTKILRSTRLSRTSRACLVTRRRQPSAGGLPIISTPIRARRQRTRLISRLRSSPFVQPHLAPTVTSASLGHTLFSRLSILGDPPAWIRCLCVRAVTCAPQVPAGRTGTAGTMDDACHKATCAAPAAGSTLQWCATLKMHAMIVAGITACHVRFPAGTLVQIHSFSTTIFSQFSLIQNCRNEGGAVTLRSVC